jgi:hypothetical protein
VTGGTQIHEGKGWKRIKYADGSILYNFPARNADGSDHTCEVASKLAPMISLDSAVNLETIAQAKIDYKNKFERVLQDKPQTVEFEAARARFCLAYGKREMTKEQYDTVRESLQTLELDYLSTVGNTPESSTTGSIISTGDDATISNNIIINRGND